MEGSDIYDIMKWGHTTKIRVSHVAPLLKLVSNKGDSTGLGNKNNPQAKVREQEYSQSPSLFQVSQ